MSKLRSPRGLPVASLAVFTIMASLLAGCGPGTVAGQPRETGGSTTCEAVQAAFSHARSDGGGGTAFGGVVGDPDSVMGDLVSLDAAVRVQAGHPIDADSSEWLMKDDPVWMMVFEGTVDATRRTSDRDQATSRVYRQVSIIMDAESGRLISRSAHPAGQERDVSSLDDLSSCLS